MASMGVLDEAGLVQRVGVQRELDTGLLQTCRHLSMTAGVAPQSS